MMVIAEHHKRRGQHSIGTSRDPLINRAVNAWRRQSRVWMEPRKVTVAEYEGKRYVVLWRPGTRGGWLAVYRVRTYDGVLRLMKRPPHGLIRELEPPLPRVGALSAGTVWDDDRNEAVTVSL